jgi:nucleoid DNA-binding protein
MQITDLLLSKNPQFNKKEQKLIWNCLLTKINLTLKRGKVVEIKIRKFGTIHTHRNNKRLGRLTYQKRMNKKKWAENKQVIENTPKFLLF